MNLDIKKIRLNELKSFIQSETFSNFTTIPITLERAKSYINNPNAKSDDVVLYLGFIKNNLVAFRTLFAGQANSGDKQIHFGWCSGSWVHQDYREKGLSSHLLNEAYLDWDKKLMFTNYAPNSEKLYLKTGWFHPIHQFNGARGYLFLKTAKLFKKENSKTISKAAFSIINIIIFFVSYIRILFISKQTQDNIRFETIKFPDEECYSFKNKKSKSDYLFNNDENKLKWIFQWPWISDSNNSIVENYPFSSYSKSFYYKTVKIFFQNRFIGFFIFSVRTGHLKTLFFNVSDGFDKDIAAFLKRYCAKNKIEIITIYNYDISSQVFTQKFPFLHVKKYGQKIYSSFKIDNKKQIRFHDGDGDVFFT